MQNLSRRRFLEIGAGLTLAALIGCAEEPEKADPAVVVSNIIPAATTTQSPVLVSALDKTIKSYIYGPVPDPDELEEAVVISRVQGPGAAMCSIRPESTETSSSDVLSHMGFLWFRNGLHYHTFSAAHLGDGMYISINPAFTSQQIFGAAMQIHSGSIKAPYFPGNPAHSPQDPSEFAEITFIPGQYGTEGITFTDQEPQFGQDVDLYLGPDSLDFGDSVISVHKVAGRITGKTQYREHWIYSVDTDNKLSRNAVIVTTKDGELLGMPYRTENNDRYLFLPSSILEQSADRWYAECEKGFPDRTMVERLVIPDVKRT